MASLSFPPLEFADEHGLLAVGGNLEPETLLTAYSQGIFPWPVFEESQLTWFSPPQRAVVFVNEFRAPRSLKKYLRGQNFELRINTAFHEVISACAALVNRGEQSGTWITEAMIAGYSELHRRGYCHSFECWRDEQLLGGLYGVAIGGMFAGESMFYRETNASKFCIVELFRYLEARGVEFVDCQQQTELLAQFGCREIPREQFIALLQKNISREINLFECFSPK